MATRIRLQRHGRKSYAFYSIVIADSRAPRDGKFTEKIGLFDIWTVLFPGTVFLIVIKSLYNSLLILPELVKKADNLFEKITIFLQMNFHTSESLYELFELLLIAYLVGLLLQELGSIFKNKVLYKKGKPMDLLGDPQGGVFNAVQIQKLSSLL